MREHKETLWARLAQGLAQKPWLGLIGLALLAAALHWQVWSLPPIGAHHWRQTVTLSYIQGYSEYGAPFSDPRIAEFSTGPLGSFRQDFPLVYWLLAQLYTVTGGESVLAIRIFFFLSGLLGAWGMLALARSLGATHRVSGVAAWVFLFSPLVFIYCTNPLPDTLYCGLGIWAGVGLLKWLKTGAWVHLIYSVPCLAWAGLGKPSFLGPGVAVAVGFLFWAFTRKKRFAAHWGIGVGAYAVALLALGAWFVPLFLGGEGVGGVYSSSMSAWGDVTSQQLLSYLEANLITFLPELIVGYSVFPLFLVGTYIGIQQWRKQKSDGLIVIAVWAATVLIYWAMHLHWIAGIHDYYLIPALPLTALAVAKGAGVGWSNRLQWVRVSVWVLVTLLPVAALLRAQGRWDISRADINPDLIQNRAALQAAVPDSALVLVGADYTQTSWLWYTHKRGFRMHPDGFNAEQVRQWMAQGVQYVYCDRPEWVANSALTPYIQDTVTRIGSIGVYRLGPSN